MTFVLLLSGWRFSFFFFFLWEKRLINTKLNLNFESTFNDGSLLLWRSMVIQSYGFFFIRTPGIDMHAESGSTTLRFHLR